MKNKTKKTLKVMEYAKRVARSSKQTRSPFEPGLLTCRSVTGRWVVGDENSAPIWFRTQLESLAYIKGRQDEATATWHRAKVIMDKLGI